MWKVEFTKNQNTITLYVADDALVYPHSALGTDELQQYFETQLGKLAFMLERTLHTESRKKTSSVVYLRSCFAIDAKISELNCHYQAYVNNEERKPSLAYLGLQGVGKNYTDSLQPAVITYVNDAEAERKFASFDQTLWLARLGESSPIPSEMPSYRTLDQLEHGERNLENYLKTNVTIALYHSAMEYYRYIFKHYNKDLKTINEQIDIFNKKFDGIAKINPNFSVTPLKQALQNMQPLPLQSQDGENFEAKVNNLLLHAADVIGDALIQNYGRAFEYIKSNLNYFNEKCRLNIDENTLCQPFFEPVSKPTDNNVGIVTDHVPLVRNAMSVIALGTKAVLENTVKSKRREFVLNPWVMDSAMQEKFNRLHASHAGGNNSNNDLIEAVPAPTTSQRSDNIVTAENDAYASTDRSQTSGDVREKSISEILRELDDMQAEQEVTVQIVRKPGFFLSTAMKRVMIGAIIGLCAAAIAATIVSLTLFSGGTIVAPLVAAGMVLAIGGTGPAIATIIGGVLLTTALGAGIAALFNYGINKRQQSIPAASPSQQHARPTHVTRRKSEAETEESSSLSDHSFFHSSPTPVEREKPADNVSIKQRK